MLFNLIIIAEPTERRSMRSRKPKVYFDSQIAQSLEPSKPSIPSIAAMIHFSALAIFSEKAL
jgi:hypothetical protein